MIIGVASRISGVLVEILAPQPRGAVALQGHGIFVAGGHHGHSHGGLELVIDVRVAVSLGQLAAHHRVHACDADQKHSLHPGGGVANHDIGLADAGAGDLHAGLGHLHHRHAGIGSVGEDIGGVEDRLGAGGGEAQVIAVGVVLVELAEGHHISGLRRVQRRHQVGVQRLVHHLGGAGVLHRQELQLHPVAGVGKGAVGVLRTQHVDPVRLAAEEVGQQTVSPDDGIRAVIVVLAPVVVAHDKDLTARGGGVGLSAALVDQHGEVFTGGEGGHAPEVFVVQVNNGGICVILGVVVPRQGVVALPHQTGGHGVIHDGAVAQLAVGPLAPGVKGTVILGAEGHGVIRAGLDGPHLILGQDAPRAQRRDGGDPGGHRGVSGHIGVAQTQQAQTVGAKGIEGAVPRHQHGVPVAGLDLEGGAEVESVLVGVAGAHLRRAAVIAADILHAQLAVGVAAPGPNRAVGTDSQGVVGAGGHLSDVVQIGLRAHLMAHQNGIGVDQVVRGGGSAVDVAGIVSHRGLPVVAVVVVVGVAAAGVDVSAALIAGVPAAGDSLAQLTLVVAAPGVHVARGIHRQGKAVALRNIHDGLPAVGRADVVDLLRGEAVIGVLGKHHVAAAGRGAAAAAGGTVGVGAGAVIPIIVVVKPVAQLAVVVVAPGVDVALIGQGQEVLEPVLMSGIAIGVDIHDELVRAQTAEDHLGGVLIGDRLGMPEVLHVQGVAGASGVGIGGAVDVVHVPEGELTPLPYGAVGLEGDNGVLRRGHLCGRHGHVVVQPVHREHKDLIVAVVVVVDIVHRDIDRTKGVSGGHQITLAVDDIKTGNIVVAGGIGDHRVGGQITGEGGQEQVEFAPEYLLQVILVDVEHLVGVHGDHMRAVSAGVHHALQPLVTAADRLGIDSGGQVGLLVNARRPNGQSVEVPAAGLGQGLAAGAGVVAALIVSVGAGEPHCAVLLHGIEGLVGGPAQEGGLTDILGASVHLVVHDLHLGQGAALTHQARLGGVRLDLHVLQADLVRQAQLAVAVVAEGVDQGVHIGRALGGGVGGIDHGVGLGGIRLLEGMAQLAHHQVVGYQDHGEFVARHDLAHLFQRRAHRGDHRLAAIAGGGGVGFDLLHQQRRAADRQGAGVPLAQLALAVVAPGIGPGGDVFTAVGLADELLRGHRHGVVQPRGDLHGVLEVNIRSAVRPGHLGGHQRSDLRAGAALAQLAQGVVAPGEDGAVRPEGHGKVAAGGDGDDMAQRAGHAGRDALDYPGGGIAGVVLVGACLVIAVVPSGIPQGDLLLPVHVAGVAQAELTLVVAAEGPDRALAVQQQGVVSARGHLNDLHVVGGGQPGDGVQERAVVRVIPFHDRLRSHLADVVDGIALPLTAASQVGVQAARAKGVGQIQPAVAAGEVLQLVTVHLPGGPRLVGGHRLIVRLLGHIEAGLAVAVVAPGEHLAVVAQGHHVVLAHGDLNDVGKAVHLDGRAVLIIAVRAVIRTIGRDIPVDISAVDTVGIVIDLEPAPHPHGAVRLQGHAARPGAQHHGGGDLVHRLAAGGGGAADSHTEHRDHIAVGVQKGHGGAARLLQRGIGRTRVAQGPAVAGVLGGAQNAGVGDVDGIAGILRIQVNGLYIHAGGDQVKADIIVPLRGLGVDVGQSARLVPGQHQLVEAGGAAADDTAAEGQLHDGGLVLAHKVGPLLLAALVADAQLALAVVAPGQHAAVLHHGHREPAAGGNNGAFVQPDRAHLLVRPLAGLGGGELKGIPEIGPLGDRVARQAARELTQRAVAEADHAHLIHAVHRPDHAQQRVAAAAGEGGDAIDPAHIGGQGVVFRGVRQAQLALGVGTPTKEGGNAVVVAAGHRLGDLVGIGADVGHPLVVPGHHHHMVAAGSDAVHAGDVAELGLLIQAVSAGVDLNGGGGIVHHAALRHGGGDLVAQLALVVGAPGVHFAVGQQGHGEPVARGHVHHVLQQVAALEALDLHRHVGGFAVALAQLAPVVAARGVDLALAGQRQQVVGPGEDLHHVGHAHPFLGARAGDQLAHRGDGHLPLNVRVVIHPDMAVITLPHAVTLLVLGQNGAGIGRSIGLVVKDLGEVLLAQEVTGGVVADQRMVTGGHGIVILQAAVGTAQRAGVVGVRHRPVADGIEVCRQAAHRQHVHLILMGLDIVVHPGAVVSVGVDIVVVALEGRAHPVGHVGGGVLVLLVVEHHIVAAQGVIPVGVKVAAFRRIVVDAVDVHLGGDHHQLVVVAGLAVAHHVLAAVGMPRVGAGLGDIAPPAAVPSVLVHIGGIGEEVLILVSVRVGTHLGHAGEHAGIGPAAGHARVDFLLGELRVLAATAIEVADLGLAAQPCLHLLLIAGAGTQVGGHVGQGAHHIDLPVVGGDLIAVHVHHQGAEAVAGGHAHHVGEHLAAHIPHLDGIGPVGKRAVAQLALLVAAPSPGGAVGLDRHGVVLPRRDLGGGEPAAGGAGQHLDPQQQAAAGGALINLDKGVAHLGIQRVGRPEHHRVVGGVLALEGDDALVQGGELQVGHVQHRIVTVRQEVIPLLLHVAHPVQDEGDLLAAHQSDLRRQIVGGGVVVGAPGPEGGVAQLSHHHGVVGIGVVVVAQLVLVVGAGGKDRACVTGHDHKVLAHGKGRNLLHIGHVVHLQTIQVAGDGVIIVNGGAYGAALIAQLALAVVAPGQELHRVLLQLQLEDGVLHLAHGPVKARIKGLHALEDQGNGEVEGGFSRGDLRAGGIAQLVVAVVAPAIDAGGYDKGCGCRDLRHHRAAGPGGGSGGFGGLAVPFVHGGRAAFAGVHRYLIGAHAAGGHGGELVALRTAVDIPGFFPVGNVQGHDRPVAAAHAKVDDLIHKDLVAGIVGVDPSGAVALPQGQANGTVAVAAAAAVAQLAVSVGAKCEHRAIGEEHRAGVSASGDAHRPLQVRGGAAALALQRHLGGGELLLAGRALGQLTAQSSGDGIVLGKGIAAPDVHIAALGQSQGVVGAGRDRHDAVLLLIAFKILVAVYGMEVFLRHHVVAQEDDRASARHAGTHLHGYIVGMSGGADARPAQLAADVLAPGPHVTLDVQRHGEVIPGGHRHEGEGFAALRQIRLIGNAAGAVSKEVVQAVGRIQPPIGAGIAAQLAVGVVTPHPHMAHGVQRHSVVCPGGHHRRRLGENMVGVGAVPPRSGVDLAVAHPNGQHQHVTGVLFFVLVVQIEAGPPQLVAGGAHLHQGVVSVHPALGGEDGGIRRLRHHKVKLVGDGLALAVGDQVEAHAAAVQDLLQVDEQVLAGRQGNAVGVVLPHGLELAVLMEHGVLRVILPVLLQQQSLGLAVTGLDRPEAVGGGAVAQLALVVLAPVPDVTVCAHCGHMLPAHRDHHGGGEVLRGSVVAFSLGHRHGKADETGAHAKNGLLVDLVVTELSAHIVAPGIYRAAAGAFRVLHDDFAGVAARGDGADVVQRAHAVCAGLLVKDGRHVGQAGLRRRLDTAQRPHHQSGLGVPALLEVGLHLRPGRHFVGVGSGAMVQRGIVADPAHVAGAQLTIAVLAEGQHRAVGHQRQGMVAAGGHHHGVAHEAAHLGGHVLPVRVVSGQHPGRHAVGKGRAQGGRFLPGQLQYIIQAIGVGIGHVLGGAQLAVGVVAPGKHRAVVADGQHMAVAGGNGQDIAQVIAAASAGALQHLGGQIGELGKGGPTLHDLHGVVRGVGIELTVGGDIFVAAGAVLVVRQRGLVVLVGPHHAGVGGSSQPPLVVQLVVLVVDLVGVGHKVVRHRMTVHVDHAVLIQPLQGDVVQLHGQHIFLLGEHSVAPVVPHGVLQLHNTVGVRGLIEVDHRFRAEVRVVMAGSHVQRVQQVLKIEVIAVPVIALGRRLEAQHLFIQLVQVVNVLQLGIEGLQQPLGKVGHGHFIQVGLTHLIQPEDISGVARAQLALVVAAPAPDRPLLGKGYGEALARCQADDLAADSHGVVLVAAQRRQNSAVSHTIMAGLCQGLGLHGQLAQRTAAPAIDLAGPGQGHGMVSARGDGDHLPQGGVVGVQAHLKGRAAELHIAVANAQLSLIVVAPGPDGAVSLQRDTKIVAQRDGGGSLVGIPAGVAGGIGGVEHVDCDHSGTAGHRVVHPHGGDAVLVSGRQGIALNAHNVGVGAGDTQLHAFLAVRPHVPAVILRVGHIARLALFVHFPAGDLLAGHGNIGLHRAALCRTDIAVDLGGDLRTDEPVAGVIVLHRRHDVHRVAVDQLQIVAQHQLVHRGGALAPVGQVTARDRRLLLDTGGLAAGGCAVGIEGDRRQLVPRHFGGHDGLADLQGAQVRFAVLVVLTQGGIHRHRDGDAVGVGQIPGEGQRIHILAAARDPGVIGHRLIGGEDHRLVGDTLAFAHLAFLHLANDGRDRDPRVPHGLLRVAEHKGVEPLAAGALDLHGDGIARGHHHALRGDAAVGGCEQRQGLHVALRHRVLAGQNGPVSAVAAPEQAVAAILQGQVFVEAADDLQISTIVPGGAQGKVHRPEGHLQGVGLRGLGHLAGGAVVPDHHRIPGLGQLERAVRHRDLHPVGILHIKHIVVQRQVVGLKDALFGVIAQRIAGPHPVVAFLIVAHRKRLVLSASAAVALQCKGIGLAIPRPIPDRSVQVELQGHILSAGLILNVAVQGDQHFGRVFRPHRSVEGEGTGEQVVSAGQVVQRGKAHRVADLRLIRPLAGHGGKDGGKGTHLRLHRNQKRSARHGLLAGDVGQLTGLVVRLIQAPIVQNGVVDGHLCVRHAVFRHRRHMVQREVVQILRLVLLQVDQHGALEAGGVVAGLALINIVLALGHLQRMVSGLVFLVLDQLNGPVFTLDEELLGAVVPALMVAPDLHGQVLIHRVNDHALHRHLPGDLFHGQVTVHSRLIALAVVFFVVRGVAGQSLLCVGDLRHQRPIIIVVGHHAALAHRVDHQGAAAPDHLAVGHLDGLAANGIGRADGGRLCLPAVAVRYTEIHREEVHHRRIDGKVSSLYNVNDRTGVLPLAFLACALGPGHNGIAAAGDLGGVEDQLPVHSIGRQGDDGPFRGIQHQLVIPVGAAGPQLTVALGDHPHVIGQAVSVVHHAGDLGDIGRAEAGLVGGAAVHQREFAQLTKLILAPGEQLALVRVGDHMPSACCQALDDAARLQGLGLTGQGGGKADLLISAGQTVFFRGPAGGVNAVFVQSQRAGLTVGVGAKHEDVRPVDPDLRDSALGVHVHGAVAHQQRCVVFARRDAQALVADIRGRGIAHGQREGNKPTAGLSQSARGTQLTFTGPAGDIDRAAVAAQKNGMVIARGDLGHAVHQRAALSSRGVGGGIADEVRRVPDIGALVAALLLNGEPAFQAQLSVGVVAPGRGVDGLVAAAQRDGAGEAASGQRVPAAGCHRDGLGEVTLPGILGVGGGNDLIGIGTKRPRRTGQVARTQLSAGVVAPGVDVALAAGHRHGVVAARGDRGRAHKVLAVRLLRAGARHDLEGHAGVALRQFVDLVLVNVDHRLVIRVDPRTLAVHIDVLVLAQLTSGVVAPGVHRAVGGAGQHMVEARGDLLHQGEPGHDSVGALDPGGVASVGQLLRHHAGAQLTVSIVAPGPDGAVRLQRHGKVLARAHHGGGEVVGVVYRDVELAGVDAVCRVGCVLLHHAGHRLVGTLRLLVRQKNGVVSRELLPGVVLRHLFFRGSYI